MAVSYPCSLQQCQDELRNFSDKLVSIQLSGIDYVVISMIYRQDIRVKEACEGG
jgi:hypothetical protein